MSVIVLDHIIFILTLAFRTKPQKNELKSTILDNSFNCSVVVTSGGSCF